MVTQAFNNKLFRYQRLNYNIAAFGTEKGVDYLKPNNAQLIYMSDQR